MKLLQQIYFLIAAAVKKELIFNQKQQEGIKEDVVPNIYMQAQILN